MFSEMSSDPFWRNSTEYLEKVFAERAARWDSGLLSGFDLADKQQNVRKLETDIRRIF